MSNYRIVINVSGELKRRLEEAARTGHRSVPSEVLFRIDQSFNAPLVIESVSPTTIRVSDPRWVRDEAAQA